VRPSPTAWKRRRGSCRGACVSWRVDLDGVKEVRNFVNACFFLMICCSCRKVDVYRRTGVDICAGYVLDM
jgi:hypothetical protein